MNNKDKIEESARFVARHFSPDAFSRKRTWQRLGIGDVLARRLKLRRSLKYAAAGIAVIALSASAIVLIRHNAMQPAPVSEPTETAVQHVSVSATLRFDDTPLSEVVNQIQQTYGVKVTNIPDEDYQLTGVYEGTADDILATINDILGTNLEIEK